MIVKHLSIKSKAGVGRLLDYLVQSEERLIGKDGRPLLLVHNLRSDDPQGWKKEFMDNEQYRKLQRKGLVYAHHEILSFHRDDTKDFSQKVFESISRKYIDLRGKNALVVAVAHHDRDHRHIHLAISGIEYRTGKATRVSKQEFGEIKKAIQDYQIQRFPQLDRSVVDHGRKGRTGREDAPDSRLSKKERIAREVEAIRQQTSTPEAFIQALRREGFEVYARRGKETGIIVDGKKYRFSTIGVGNPENSPTERRTSQRLIEKPKSSRSESRLDQLNEIRAPGDERKRENIDFDIDEKR